MCGDPGDLVGVVEPAAGGAREEAWGKRVDSDSAGTPLGCEFAGEGDDPSFARAIAGHRVRSRLIMAAGEATFTITPAPRANMSRAASWVSAYRLTRLVSSSWRTRSSGSVSAGSEWAMPALLTRMSIRPKRSMAAVTNVWRSVGDRTSQRTACSQPDSQFDVGIVPARGQDDAGASRIEHANEALAEAG